VSDFVQTDTIRTPDPQMSLAFVDQVCAFTNCSRMNDVRLGQHQEQASAMMLLQNAAAAKILPHCTF